MNGYVQETGASRTARPDGACAAVPAAPFRGAGGGRAVRALAVLLALASLRCPADNLVVNGDFETVDPADVRKPAAWALPDGLGVRWVADPAGDHGKVIQLDTRIQERDMEARWRELGMEEWHIPNAAKNAIADTYGLSYYSQWFDIEPGASYELQVAVRQPEGRGGAKVWVRGYGLVRDKERRLYDKLMTIRPRDENWHSYRETFHPTKNTPAVRRMRVMLYAYHPAGLFFFDRVSVRKIEP